jgi:SAM-dependent methyltransferase
VALLRRVENVTERMDRPGVDPAQLAGALDHVTAVNRWLGARRALLRTLPEALDGLAAPISVLDVGTGSADLPRAMLQWAQVRDCRLNLTAVDPHAATLREARRRAGPTGIRFVRANGLRLPFATGSFDIALLSMTLHHVDGPDQVTLIRELGRVARGGRVLVGELERSIPNYLGARLLAATVWRSNPVTRHDGPISVLRAFTPTELEGVAVRAGLRRPRVRRHPFYRLVLLADC